MLKLLLKLTKSNHSVDYVMHVPVNRTALPNIDRLSMFYAKCERIALQPAAWRRCGRGVFSIPSVAALNIHEAPSIFMKTPSPSLLRFKIFFNTPAAPAAATSTSRDIVNQWRPPHARRSRHYSGLLMKAIWINLGTLEAARAARGGRRAAQLIISCVVTYARLRLWM